MALSILKRSKTEVGHQDLVATRSGIGSGDAAALGGDQRGQGKRRDRHTWTIVTSIPYDDGHQWRKYGEKMISSSKFPRCYYRCTYKAEQGCQATKQVQQKDFGDPPSFLVTYTNKHTCSSTFMAPHFVVDPCQSEPFSLCFDSSAGGIINEQPAFLTSLPTIIQDCDGRMPNWQHDTSSSSNQHMSLNVASQAYMETAGTILSSFDDICSNACPMWISHRSDVDYMMMEPMELIEFDGKELIF
ncbi:uncharacterized protein [Elaeis guineensis]|uniref:Probable WRKY transcription factor 14 n=1 Tax=Elaeis guineensis var. tenera TaxID=51953 RepID=A0A6I9RSS3_ELAGV|nr:probable WRKY transcription factor 14 [Elaeis guineensis]